ncbi:MAG: hypothetical protein FWD73_00105 [Polyangiaceae bacterium]|nr:hypothetical protein [Polyangiaceae bacterium]
MDLPLDGGSGGITRAADGRYLVAGGQLQPAGNIFMAVAYYKSNLTRDTSIGNQDGIVPIPVSTALTNPPNGSVRGVGLRAVYIPDGSRTVVVASNRV